MSDMNRKKQKEAFILSIKNGCSRVKAAKACGVGTTTIFNWLHKDENFKTAVDSAMDSRIAVVEDALYKLASGKQKLDKDNKPMYDTEGNPIMAQTNNQVVAQIFWLKNRGKGQWRDKHDLEITAPKVVNKKTFIQAGEEPKIVDEEPIKEEDTEEVG